MSRACVRESDADAAPLPERSIRPHPNSVGSQGADAELVSIEP